MTLPSAPSYSNVEDGSSLFQSRTEILLRGFVVAVWYRNWPTSRVGQISIETNKRYNPVMLLQNLLGGVARDFEGVAAQSMRERGGTRSRISSHPFQLLLCTLSAVGQIRTLHRKIGFRGFKKN